MKLIFLGAPGAGKGTLAAKVAEEYGIPHISTGDIFRANIKNRTPLGVRVKAIIDSGGLVGDDITCELVRDRLSQPDAQAGYILDGFPRTIAQAEALCGFATVDAAVNFDISDEEVVERLGGRRVCRGCGQNYNIKFLAPKTEGKCDSCGGELFTRDDDKADAIRCRLEVYHKQTAPLIDFYEKKGILRGIDARPDTGTVLAEFKRMLPKR